MKLNRYDLLFFFQFAPHGHEVYFVKSLEQCKQHVFLPKFQYNLSLVGGVQPRLSLFIYIPYHIPLTFNNLFAGVGKTISQI